MSNAERLAADPTITHLDGYKYLLRTVAAADGDPAMLLAVPYLLIASICTNALADCAPDWLHLVVLWALWNAMKFIILGPVSLILLIRARTQEAIARHRVAARPAVKPFQGASVVRR